MKRAEEEFKNIWRTGGTSKIGEVLFNISDKKVFPILEGIRLNKNSKILDVGCATGRTLILFRKAGYKNSIGIDISKDSLKICNFKGLKTDKDVFLKDIRKTKYKPMTFDLVFSEGLLEHFEDMQPLVDAMCSLSSKYVLILQPNHTSMSLSRYVYRLLEISYIYFLRRKFVYEIPYKVEDYETVFNKAGFKLVKIFNLVMDSGWGLLFKKVC